MVFLQLRLANMLLIVKGKEHVPIMSAIGKKSKTPSTSQSKDGGKHGGSMGVGSLMLLELMFSGFV